MAWHDQEDGRSEGESFCIQHDTRVTSTVVLIGPWLTRVKETVLIIRNPTRLNAVIGVVTSTSRPLESGSCVSTQRNGWSRLLVASIDARALIGLSDDRQ